MTAPPHRARHQSGAATMMAVVIMAIVFILITSGLTMIQLSKGTITRQLIYHGQAVNAAQAGLVDSLSWFRRQAVQPVGTFDPRRDLTLTPPVNDTDDPAVGLVREYEVSKLGAVWGRYEVTRSAVRDATQERGKTGTGTVWQVESTGYVYVKNDGSRPYNQSPNRVLRRITARSEVQRLSLVLPANAALNGYTGSRITTESSTRVLGGTSGIGIAYRQSSGSPTINGDVAGVMATSQANPYLDGIPDVFGVNQQELLGMADLVVSQASQLPDPLPAMWLTVVQGNAVFGPTKPLVGTGILVVLGDLVIQPSSLSSFNGLIYVTGDYEQNSPSQVSGSIIVRGDIDIRSSGDFSEVYYDSAILAQIQDHIGQYRFSRAPVLVRG